MTKKLKKVFLGIGSALVVTAPISAIVACGNNDPKNPFAEKKEIVIAVDGAQKRMYAAAIAKFNKSDSYKKGFRIKTVDKDAFGALDMAKSIGFTDENVADLLYMPADRMTDMLQQKALMPWSAEQFNKFVTAIGLDKTADKNQINAARAFGSAVYKGKSYLFAVPHNKEGVAVATKEALNTARSALDQKGILGLQNSAEGLFRLQDLWYGSALFNIPIKDDQGNIVGTVADFILYGDGNSWSSGFLPSDPYHAQFKKVVEAMADMWYEPLAKAYGAAQATPTLVGSAWNGSTITPGELKNFFQSDVGAVNNELIKLIKSGKLKYMLAGTWDGQVIAKQGIERLTNYSDDLDGSSGSVYSPGEFKQAPGTWSYAINARNNGASSDRIAAIMQLLKDIYSPKAFTEYFLQDTKIPYFSKLQAQVKTEADKSTSADLSNGTKLFDDATLKAALNAAIASSNPLGTQSDNAAKIRALYDWLNKYNKTYNELKEYEVSSEWKAKAVSGGIDSHAAPTIFGGITAAFQKTYTDNAYGDTSGLIDVTAKLLGVTLAQMIQNQSSNLPNPLPSWQVHPDNIKGGKNNAKWEEIKQDADVIHIRKLAKEWSGFNGDDASEKSAVTDQIVIDVTGVKTVANFNKKVAAAKMKFDKIVQDQIVVAKQFVKDFNKQSSKTSDADVVKFVTGYLTNLWNDSLRKAQYEFIEANSISKIEFSAANNEKIKFLKIKEIIELSMSALSVDQVFDVISASGSSRGSFDTQDKKFDRNNPQFGSVWPLWNEQSWGNKVWLQAAITNALTGSSTLKQAEDKFKKAAVAHIAKLFGDKVKQLIAAKAIGQVQIG